MGWQQPGLSQALPASAAAGGSLGQGPHLAKRWEPRGFSRVGAAFSSYDGDLSLPLGLALAGGFGSLHTPGP